MPYSLSNFHSFENTFDCNAAFNGGAIFLKSISIGNISSNIIKNNIATFGGGVFLLDNNNNGLWFYNTRFLNNSVESNGGAISCLRSILYLSQCALSYNRAGGAGGGLYWSRRYSTQLNFVPAIFDSNFQFNSASYGPDKATSAIKLMFLNAANNSLLQSITNYLNPVEVALKDEYNNTVATDNSTPVSVFPNIWSGSFVQVLRKGATLFSNLKLLLAPNKNVTYYFTSPIDYDSGVAMTNSVSLKTEPCLPGYYFDGKVCRLCSAGYFSNVSMSTFCNSCSKVLKILLLLLILIFRDHFH